METFFRKKFPKDLAIFKRYSIVILVGRVTLLCLVALPVTFGPGLPSKVTS
jgi:hypothetical protein